MAATFLRATPSFFTNFDQVFGFSATSATHLLQKNLFIYFLKTKTRHAL
jgi:hypothetical protein